MIRLRITHHTSYHYTIPVLFGEHRLVLRPREGHDLQVESLQVHTHPEADLYWHRDLFGNSIALAHFEQKSDFLEIQSESQISLGTAPTRPGLLKAFPSPYPPVYAPFEQPLILGYLTPVYPEESAQLHDWASGIPAILEQPDAVQRIKTLGNWIYKNIHYQRREQSGVQTPLETLALKMGSCRDMATLLMETARALKIAARFASGYLNNQSARQGTASPHAWTEVYFPEHGWFGFDPALGQDTSSLHITTGVCFHPRGVMPVAGTYFGSPEQFSEMRISVKIEEFNP